MDNTWYLWVLVWLLLWFPSVPVVGPHPSTESHTAAMFTPVGHAPWKWLWGASVWALLLGFCQFVGCYSIYLFEQKQLEEDRVFSVGELSSLSMGGLPAMPESCPQAPLGAALPAASVHRARGELSAGEKCWCSESSEPCREHPSAPSAACTAGGCVGFVSVGRSSPDSTGRLQCHLGSVVAWVLLFSD